MNSEIRTLHFAQGVEVEPADGIVEESGNISLANNTADQDTGLSFDLNDYREVGVHYSIRRRTDSTTGLIERGYLRLTADPDNVGDSWILSHPERNDEGTTPGVTFSKDVVGDVVTLEASTTNLAGDNHECIVSYRLEPLFT